MKKKIAVIPAFNEEKTIRSVIEATRRFVDEVIVVNDGSSDRSWEIARDSGAIVFSHIINRGLGATLGTGIKAAVMRGADIIITLDADGQHDPSEIPKFVHAIEGGADVVIGSRLKDGKNMPFHRYLANTIGNIITLILFGCWTTDSQSGFRAFNRLAAEKIEIKSNRMEVSSEIIFEARAKKLILREVPIHAIYTDYSLSKGQSFFVGIKTLAKLVLRRIS